MTPREQRGLIIAATCRLHRNDDGTWRVPSQTNPTVVFYTVNLETKVCTCPDCTEGGFVCKHYHAATFVHRRDVLPDGTVIETKSITLSERKTYKQDWFVGGMLEKAFHYFQFNKDEYLNHYHLRSNVESTFSAVKRKFGPDVMNRSEAGMVNEVLCKFLLHNLTCLIMEQECLGISPVFWKDEPQLEALPPAVLNATN